MKRTILTTVALLAATGSIALREAMTPLPAMAENLQHTQQLLSTRQCPQCNLTGAGLILANLEGANLSGADLSRANLSRANLTGADLSGANLTGASLNGANLAGANLSGANLNGTDLRDAYLVNTQLFGVNLNTAYVRGAIGIPEYAGTPEDFYAWGAVESQRGNYRAAIDFYNQALSLKPDYAPAFLGRALARFRLGDENGAIQDAERSSVLFTAQGNTRGYQASNTLIQGIEFEKNPPKVESRPSLGNAIVGIGSLLFQLLSPF
ncbi:MAG: pentapeptide repeat-containing protein [Coleofasciculus sp. S288]|nr:pentapeptide repeat-containing protein [Coleofasciculus sp. S288]